MEEHLDRYYRFKVIEHQRWWPCRGWIPLLLGNERPEWSDEYLVQVPSIHKFSLPPPTFKTDKATKKRIKVTWEWASDSWQIDESDKSVDKEGWEYGGWDWKRWSPRSSGLHILTRRRHWIRNARLIEEDEEKETTPISIRRNSCSIPPSVSTSLSSTDSSLCDSSATLSVSPTPSFVQQTKSYSTSTVSLNHHSSRPFSDRLTVDSHFWLCR
ncbi:uncharacterized protein B0P05DRAFT_581287 [Gilbertella persicaria]|nr:uncharacterized protein B0P05DRAFT_581287 [Gilbertella persicaria]KAI8061481.1 hypothetical protein B0P05DRAFT_581287 [Gilbertella persicaria]